LVKSSQSNIVFHRLIRVVAAAFATSMALSGMVVILPLYATQTLGLNNAEFSRVLSLRMLGITFGVLLLGAISDRFGTRRLTGLSLIAGGLCFSVLGMVPLVGFLILIPLFSGFLSTAFVNLNHLTQLVDVQRQGMANTWYRASGTIAGIIAPIIMTQLFSQMMWVMAASGVLLVICGLLIRSYPMQENPSPFMGWGVEFRSMASQYRLALGQRHLMLFLHGSLIWAALSAVISTFAAIRLTHDLGTATVLYGNSCALGSALSLGAILLLGVWLDKLPIKSATMWLFMLSSFGVVALGISNNVSVAIIAFIVATVAGNAAVSPLSIWISRESGDAGMSLAFTVQKVLSAIYLAVATFTFGLLEPAIGIKSLFLWCGILSLVVLGAMMLLRNPPENVEG
jgi:hypothetical protein